MMITQQTQTQTQTQPQQLANQSGKTIVVHELSLGHHCESAPYAATAKVSVTITPRAAQMMA